MKLFSRQQQSNKLPANNDLPRVNIDQGQEVYYVSGLVKGLQVPPNSAEIHGDNLFFRNCTGGQAQSDLEVLPNSQFP